jgi:hypothetical protein
MALATEKAFGGRKASEIMAKVRAIRSGNLPMPAKAPPGSGRAHGDFVVSFEAYAAHLRGTPDEVWTKHFRSLHGAAKMTFAEWDAALAVVKQS